MKKKIFICVLCTALLACTIAAGTLAASAAETRVITENMDSIQKQLANEEITLAEYTQSTKALNRLLKNKKLDEVKATVTFDKAMSVKEAYRVTQKDEVQMEAMEMRFYQGDEPFTAFVRNIGEEETNAQVARIAEENNLVFSGVISTNVTLPSEQLSALEAEASVYCVDASADDYLEEKSDAEPEQKEGFRKSLAWELGN